MRRIKDVPRPRIERGSPFTPVFNPDPAILTCPGCGQRGVLNRKSLSTLKVFIAPGYRGYIFGVRVACVRGKCGGKVWSTNSSEFLSAQDAAVKDLYPSRLPRDATSHVIDDKILARVGRYAVGGDANFTRLAEALAEEDWVEYMKAGRKYRRWVSTWRQSAVGAPQGIEAPAWLSFDEYFHNAYLGPAQLREVFVEISQNRRSYIKGCLMQGDQPGIGSVLRIDAKYIHNCSTGIPRVHVGVMNEQGMLLSHVMLDTDNSHDLRGMVDGLAIQYKGREEDLKVVYLDKGCCSCEYKELFGRINPSVELRLDLFHWERRIEQYVQRYHPIRTSFFSALRQCVFCINSEDEARVLDAIRGTGRWTERLTRREYSRYVRKTIPPPDILCPRLEAFYAYYTQLNEQLRSTGEQFLLDGFDAQWSENISHATAGCLSDHPDVPLHAEAGQDHIGDSILPVWRTSRSTSQLEGYHASLSKACKGSRLGADLLNAIVHEAAASWNRRAFARERSDICPITDVKEWGEFQRAMSSLMPAAHSAGVQYQGTHALSHLAFGLDYTSALHREKLLDHVTQENAEAMALVASMNKHGSSSSSSSTALPCQDGIVESVPESPDGEGCCDDIEPWGIDGSGGDVIDSEAIAEMLQNSSIGSGASRPRASGDLRRQSAKFRGSIFKAHCPLANARSATLFRDLNAKYHRLEVADRSVRIWAEFELQRNIEAQAVKDSPGVLPSSERIAKTSITWCMKALRRLEASKDGNDVSGGGPAVPRVEFDPEGREFQLAPSIGALEEMDEHIRATPEAVDITPAAREKLWREVALELQQKIRMKALYIPRGTKTCSNCGVPFQVPSSADLGILGTSQSHPCIPGYKMYRYCPLTIHPDVQGYLSLEEYKKLVLPDKQSKTRARKRAREETLCPRCGDPLAETHLPLSSDGYTVYWCPVLDGSRWTFEKWRDTPGLGPRRLAMVKRNAAGATKKLRSS